MALERLSNRIEDVENKLTEVANVLLSIGGDTYDPRSTTPGGKGKVLIVQIDCSSTEKGTFLPYNTKQAKNK